MSVIWKPSAKSTTRKQISCAKLEREFSAAGLLGGPQAVLYLDASQNSQRILSCSSTPSWAMITGKYAWSGEQGKPLVKGVPSDGQREDAERLRVRTVMSSSCSQPSPVKE